jgi:hypothetical protein
MADIKRPNYFTSQFLVEKDFTDEQAYHLNARRRHNRLLHTSGVVNGLDVVLPIGTQVTVSPGTAIDRDGREIVLVDPRTYKLATNAAGDAYLTIAYQELFDPADQDPQEANEFIRKTERPLLQDGPGVPPADGSVIVLARIRLNSAGVIESNGIDTGVRTLGGARVAPKAIDTPQLADGAVTLVKLAPEVRPLSVQGVSSITVITDNTLKRIVIGETHSARTDNPHGTTAAQIDTQGGANRLVTQINTGTGVIARSRVESAVVSGVVTFEIVPVSLDEVRSDDIDPGFGPGALSVEMALDDLAASGVASSGDPGYARTIMLRSEVDRNTGRFRVCATRQASTSGTGPVKVRWFASKPTAGADANVAISVSVTPNNATIGKGSHDFQATVHNTNNQGVTWSLKTTQQPPPANLGSLLVIGALARYTPPLLSGAFQLVAASALDSNKTATADINYIAEVFVTVSPSGPTVFGGSSIGLSASVFNTATTGVTWSIREGGNSGTLTVSGNTATYTAPTVAATTIVHVDAVSVDGNKTGTATITVPTVTVALSSTSATVFRGETLDLSATVANTATTSVTWSASDGSLSVSSDSSRATYTAPTTPGNYTVTATSSFDHTKFQSCSIHVPAVTISVRADKGSVPPNGTVNVVATISGASDTSAIWTATGGVLFPNEGFATLWSASHSAVYTITGTAAADRSRSDSVEVEVTPSGEPRLFQANQAAKEADAVPSSQARASAAPKSRSKPKRPPKTNDK